MTTDSIIALATPIAVIVAAVIQQMNAQHAARDRAALKEVADAAKLAAEKEAVLAHERELIAKDKAGELLVKTEAIHVLANDNLSKVTGQLAIANEKIQGLEKLMVSMSHKKANGGKEP